MPESLGAAADVGHRDRRRAGVSKLGRMGDWDGGRLDERQRAVVAARLRGPALVADMSWGLVDTRVLHVRAGGADYVVKAGGAGNHHIGREIDAHETAVAALRGVGRCSRLVAADRGAGLLITTYLSGRLAEGTPAAHDPAVHAQAGALLRLLHDAGSRADDAVHAALTTRALARLDEPHRLSEETAERARGILSRSRPGRMTVVPTHGDWQPRNWLWDGELLRAIDFGRFDHRPAASDLVRLSAQQWRGRPDLEAAFLDGYGGDPRDASSWPVLLLCEAVGTAVWAYQVGDEPFESQGHRMVADALALFPGA